MKPNSSAAGTGGPSAAVSFPAARIRAFGGPRNGGLTAVSAGSVGYFEGSRRGMNTLADFRHLAQKKQNPTGAQTGEGGRGNGLHRPTARRNDTPTLPQSRLATWFFAVRKTARSIGRSHRRGPDPAGGPKAGEGGLGQYSLQVRHQKKKTALRAKAGLGPSPARNGTTLN